MNFTQTDLKRMSRIRLSGLFRLASERNASLPPHDQARQELLALQHQIQVELASRGP
jgi:hypothetical protein